MTQKNQTKTTEVETAPDIRWTPDALLALMSDTTIHDWLKDAIAALAKRDPEEAFRDADLLYTLMKDRWEKHTEKHKAKQQTEGPPQ